MTDSIAQSKGRRRRDWLSALTIRLLVLFGVIAFGGLTIPDQAISAPPDAIERNPLTHVLKPPSTNVLLVPALQVRAPIEKISMGKDAVLTPPRNPRDVGWWDGSARWGSRTGQTLITGHTVHTGGGALDNLSRLQPGQRVAVSTPRKEVWYSVTEVVVYTKKQLSEHAMDLFGQEDQTGRLVLVTCKGWTGHGYTSNVVVFANPMGTLQLPRPPPSPNGPGAWPWPAPGAPGASSRLPPPPCCPWRA